MFVAGTLVLSACGGGGGNSSGSATVLPSDKLAFSLSVDPTKSIFPFPNDIAWAT